MSKKSKKSSKNVKHAAKAPVQVPPAPEGLTIKAHYDKKDGKWYWAILENKTEHFTSPDAVATDDDAKAAGQVWLDKYAKANEAGRRKLLGWKAASKAVAEEGKADAEAAPAKTKKSRTKKEPTDRKPSGLDAAAQVLKEAGEPLQCKTMVERMLAQKLWQTSGKTPAATIYAAILREIQTKGAESRFKKTDRGHFTFNG